MAAYCCPGGPVRIRRVVWIIGVVFRVVIIIGGALASSDREDTCGASARGPHTVYIHVYPERERETVRER